MGQGGHDLSTKRVCRVHFGVRLAVQSGGRHSRTVILLYLLSILLLLVFFLVLVSGFAFLSYIQF